jgi:hypothetical protein
MILNKMIILVQLSLFISLTARPVILRRSQNIGMMER